MTGDTWPWILGGCVLAYIAIVAVWCACAKMARRCDDADEEARQRLKAGWRP